jgi:NAD(P)-dependent dehydrogenase (short-subunit alcohol dehydrogenase family)
VLDRSVLFSFDSSGYLRHAARFRAGDLDVDLEGRVCLVTGANSGIGLATAQGLSRLGATVWLLCRSRERGERAARQLRAAGGGPVQLALVDVASRRSIADFVRGLTAPRVDVLVNNAGVLPARRIETPEGLELTWATNVVGPHLLTRLLRPRLEAAEQGRVINVSSGGMYTQRLDLSDPQWRRRPFDGVRAYALTKRAEVVLTERWAEELAGTRVTVNSMHPGWVETPAVRSSLPRFHRVMRGRLRTTAQGADTVVWLAACPRLAGESGRFWFDREARPTEVLPGTRTRARDRERLWELCQQQTAADL